MSAAPSVYAILRNARMYAPQRIQSRPGMSKLSSSQFGGAANPVHSIRRLNDPLSNTFTRLVGAGGDLYLATSPSSPIDTGYSGNPLAMVPFRPPNSPQSWMYIADGNRMRKVKVDGTNYQMGISPPLRPPSLFFAPPVVNSIDDFDTVGSWVPSGTAGALSTVSRYTGTVESVVYDTIGYCPFVFGGAPVVTGWASISIGGLMPGFGAGGVHAGMNVSIAQTGGGNPTEEFIIHEVIPPMQTTIGTILSISYDDFPVQVGYCTIVLTRPPTTVRSRLGYTPEMDSTPVGATVTRTPTADAIGVRPNSILNLDELNARGVKEAVRVISVSINPDGTISFRCKTGFTHSTGEQINGVFTMRGYLKNFYDPTRFVNQLSDNAQQSTITQGVGLISEIKSLNLGIYANDNLPVQEDDTLHISFQIDNIASLVEFRLVIDVDATTTDFQHTYYFKSWSQSDIQQALQGNTTIQQARQASYSGQVINQDIGTLPSSRIFGSATVLPPTSVGNPAQASLVHGSNYPFATKINPAGLSSWAELTCKISDLTKVGSDASASLNNVGGIRIYVNVAADAVCAFDSLWIQGAYGPDIGDTGVPYLYRYQPRSSKTGAKGFPSPPTRAGIEVHRQAIEVDMTQHPDPQVDTLDVYRWGGTLPQWTFVGSVPNAVGTNEFVDLQSDTSLQSAPLLELDNLQPFPTIDLPRSGVVNVTGTTVNWASGDSFNPAWAQGVQININGIFYTLYAQPSSSSRLEIVENGGTQTSVPYYLTNATLLGQPLPAFWGPYSQGTALYGFACGDKYQPGVLFLTNGNDFDSASDVLQIEVTPPSEPLMNGCMYNGISYVFSSDRAFSLYPSFGNQYVISAGTLLPAEGTNLFVPLEIPNGKGLFARYALCVGTKISFRARDGIYQTTGGEPENITYAELGLLFPHDGQPGIPVTVGTFTIYPPDDTQLNAQKLAEYDGMIYFDYIDINGTPTTLVCNTLSQPYTWSLDNYSPTIASHYGEEGQGIHSLLMGGSDGNLWQAIGAVDGSGSAFPFEVRMPQMSELVGGFQFVREGYLGLIESAVANLIVNVDGVDNIVVLPSVSGDYERIYTPLPAVKGRLFNWALTGLSPFALFQRDCQFSMRTWGDDGAFTPINPFSSLARAAASKVT